MEDLQAKMTAADAASFMGISIQSIHKHIKTKDLESFKSQNSVLWI